MSNKHKWNNRFIKFSASVIVPVFFFSAVFLDKTFDSQRTLLRAATFDMAANFLIKQTAGLFADNLCTANQSGRKKFNKSY